MYILSTAVVEGGALSHACHLRHSSFLPRFSGREAAGAEERRGREPPRGGAAELLGLRGGSGVLAVVMEVQLAPVRAWDDFFPGSDRFARPDFKDISKWNNRVVSNLLYYQTNYLIAAAAVVSIVGSVHGPHFPSGSGGRGGAWGEQRAQGLEGR